MASPPLGEQVDQGESLVKVVKKSAPPKLKKNKKEKKNRVLHVGRDGARSYYEIGVVFQTYIRSWGKYAMICESTNAKTRHESNS